MVIINLIESVKCEKHGPGEAFSRVSGSRLSSRSANRSPEEIRDRTLAAARYIRIEQLGTTDDCGFSPFCDDTSSTREMALAKIRARVEGTALAAAVINSG